MDLFELLFIALFIVIPLLEGLARQRKKGQGPPQRSPGGDRPGRPDEPEGEAPSAAEMLPDDLWELMTGQRREPAPVESDAEGAPWSEGPDEAGVAVEPAEPEDWRDEPWVVDDEVDVEPATSLEYRGAEAYSLETAAPDPIQRVVPSASERHREFHALIDRPPRRTRRRRSPLLKALRSPHGLQQAVLLKEILGPPKGLD